MEPRILVALVDRHDGRFYVWESVTGHLRSLHDTHDEMPRPTKSTSWAGLADSKVQRHLEEHVHEHYKNVLEKITQYLASEDSKQIILGGPHEVVAEFIETIPDQMKEKIIGAISPSNHHADIGDLETQVQAAIKQSHQTLVKEYVAHIEEQLQPGGRGVVGTEAVLEALNLKQTQVVLFDEELPRVGKMCFRDGKVCSIATSLERCVNCMGNMQDTDDLQEALVNLAREQDAEVIRVENPDQLASHQHIVGLRRF